MVPPRHPAVRRLLRAAGTTLALLLALPSAAHAGELEIAFCAPRNAWPMSDAQRGGYDQDIARILAEELGARATFVWTNFDAVGIRDTLHAGLCDVAIGVGEGVATMLSTVPYLRTPFVFVTRAADDHAIDSLDDPRLETLAIGTYQAGIPSVALRNRGIVENVREYASIVRSAGQDDHTPILDALVAGDVDIAIVYGPHAGARALVDDLVLRPVTPEIDFGATILQMSRVWTIGVRSHDAALRDRLNRTLAARWDDVVAAIEGYGVPQLRISRPVDRREDPATYRVGVIYPARTPASLPNADVGDGARLGASVAENALALAGGRETRLDVLHAHAPTLESVERAALRLIHVEGVDALVGGYDDGEARLLARIAAEHDVTFFNVGSEDDALRDPTCYPTTFHVAPSIGTLVSAMTAELVASGAQRLFVVAERGVVSPERFDALEGLLADLGATLAGSAWTESEQFIFFGLVGEVRAAEADAVLLLLSPDPQELLLGQVEGAGLTARVSGLSAIRGQSRPYLRRYVQVAPRLGAALRVVAWDPALPDALNETFASRTGEPMEAVSWTTYLAIVSAYAASREGVLGDVDALGDFLAAGERLGLSTSAAGFRRDDRQLLHELYVVEPLADAPWGRTPTARIATARVVGVVAPDIGAGAPVLGGGCPAR
jgi:ABC-type branched-subunit amino acid transport system substrate-binding protein